MINKLKSFFEKKRIQNRAIEDLENLPEYLLEDIGITRYDIRKKVKGPR